MIAILRGLESAPRFAVSGTKCHGLPRLLDWWRPSLGQLLEAVEEIAPSGQ